MSIQSAFLGTAVGDALGVPVEFLSRSQLRQSPVTEMRGYGTHFQPPGTWSDDSSLFFCLAEMLCQGYNLDDLAARFVAWYQKNYWTPHGDLFDIGISTRKALDRIIAGTPPTEAGENSENANGNGALMRILPLLFYVRQFPIEQRFNITQEVAKVTHGHIRSSVACFYYLEFAEGLLQGHDKFDIYKNLQQTLPSFLLSAGVAQKELDNFHRLLVNDISQEQENNISGSGYVLHSLEAAVWCLLTTNSYSDAVLRGVNLGEDTDTTGAITGGLAGLCYGVAAIPQDWINALARKNDIFDLMDRFALAFSF